MDESQLVDSWCRGKTTLRIREEQIQAFSAKIREAFAPRAAAHLQIDFAPEVEKHGLRDIDLIPTVERGIDKAATYNISREEDVELFIDCMLMLSLEFDQDPHFPWARDILSQNDLEVFIANPARSDQDS